MRRSSESSQFLRLFGAGKLLTLRPSLANANLRGCASPMAHGICVGGLLSWHMSDQTGMRNSRNKYIELRGGKETHGTRMARSNSEC